MATNFNASGEIFRRGAQKKRAARRGGLPVFAIWVYLELHLHLQLEDSSRHSRALEVAIGAASRGHCGLERPESAARHVVVGRCEVGVIEDVVGVSPKDQSQPVFIIGDTERLPDCEVRVEVSRPTGTVT